MSAPLDAEGWGLTPEQVAQAGLPVGQVVRGQNAGDIAAQNHAPLDAEGWGLTPEQVAQAQRAQALYAGLPVGQVVRGQNAGDMAAQNQAADAPDIDKALALQTPQPLPRAAPVVPPLAPNAGITAGAPPPQGPAQPAQSAPGAPGAQIGGNDVMAALNARYGVGQAQGRRVGLTGTDRDYMGTLRQEGQDINADRTQAVQAAGDAARAFGAQSDALAADAKKGLLDFQQSQAQDNELRQSIAAQSEQANARTAAKLGELAAQGVDPNHYWSQASTGTKIAAAIAVGLGTLGAGMSHGQNAALSIIQGAVADDIDAQKTNLQAHLAVLGKEAELEGTGFNQRLALLNAQRDSTMSAYHVVQSNIATQSQQFKDNAEVLAQYNEFSQKVQNQARALINPLNEQIYGITKNAQRAVAADPRKEIDERADRAIDEASKLGVSLSRADARARETNTVLHTDLPEKDVVKAAAQGKEKDAGVQLRDALDSVNGIIEKRKTLNPLWISGATKGEGQADATAAQLSLGEALKGRVNNQTMAIMSRIIPPDPYTHDPLGYDSEKLQTAKKILEDHIAEADRAAGKTHAAAAPTPDQLGVRRVGAP